ncbi:MAG: PTS sugar transporter subunit IIA [Pseudomonadota bacterium]
MSTDLSALVAPERILADASAASRKQAFAALADLLARDTGFSASEILSEVMERERLGSTAVGEGVAIPHARIDGLDAPIGAFARLQNAADFDAVDERPCDLIFMLLAPRANGADHLRALAQVSRAFRQPDVRDAIRNAGSAEAILSALCPQARGEAA